MQIDVYLSIRLDKKIHDKHSWKQIHDKNSWGIDDKFRDKIRSKQKNARLKLFVTVWIDAIY